MHALTSRTRHTSASVATGWQALGGDLTKPKGCTTFQATRNTITAVNAPPRIAVIGGGAVGLGYAIRVKRDNPELRVLVLEKAKEPRFKIGESTLSVTVENLLELGFTMPQLR